MGFVFLILYLSIKPVVGTDIAMLYYLFYWKDPVMEEISNPDM